MTIPSVSNTELKSHIIQQNYEFSRIITNKEKLRAFWNFLCNLICLRCAIARFFYNIVRHGDRLSIIMEKQVRYNFEQGHVSLQNDFTQCECSLAVYDCNNKLLKKIPLHSLRSKDYTICMDNQKFTFAINKEEREKMMLRTLCDTLCHNNKSNHGNTVGFDYPKNIYQNNNTELFNHIQREQPEIIQKSQESAEDQYHKDVIRSVFSTNEQQQETSNTQCNDYTKIAQGQEDLRKLVENGTCSQLDYVHSLEQLSQTGVAISTLCALQLARRLQAPQFRKNDSMCPWYVTNSIAQPSIVENTTSKDRINIDSMLNVDDHKTRINIHTTEEDNTKTIDGSLTVNLFAKTFDSSDIPFFTEVKNTISLKANYASNTTTTNSGTEITFHFNPSFSQYCKK